MTVKQQFPASIVDEITYSVESAYNSLHLVYSWIFTLEGEVSTEVSRKALDRALDYYPKCRCILVNNASSYKRWLRYCWEYTDTTGKDILQEIELSDPTVSIGDVVDYHVRNHVSLSIDLSSHIPLKILLIRTPQRTFFSFIMHHAVADGVGSISFIQKFITCYEDIFYQRKSAADHPPSRFEAISVPHIPFRWNYFSPRRLAPYFRYNNLFRKEPPVRLNSQQSPVDSAEFVAGVRDLPPQRLEVIRTTAKKHKATINDFLLAALFRTVKTWTREWINQSERIYIAVPTNLRPPEDRTMSNILSSVNLSLKPELISNREELFKLIREEMAVLTKNDIAQTTANLSCLLKPVPLFLMSRLLKRSIPDFAPTLLLSNLGVLSPNPAHQDGEGFHYLGPARICNIHVIPNAGGWPDVLVSTYNKQLAITQAVLSSCFSRETAESFVDAFVGEIIG
ncbi:MAG: condensation domain-containing protein [Thermodesulfobacteriota bacterium]|nr:condensation domain-containing protein [Thermodesulfobacteriota bacterium]